MSGVKTYDLPPVSSGIPRWGELTPGKRRVARPGRSGRTIAEDYDCVTVAAMNGQPWNMPFALDAGSPTDCVRDFDARTHADLASAFRSPTKG